MLSLKVVFVLLLGIATKHCNAASTVTQTDPMDGIKTDCGYVNVRTDAYMFWLLYYQDSSFAPNFLTQLDPVPIVVWLQGGPGASSTGYGNFEELGPLYMNGSRRATSWTGLAHVLFIDNPVGTGYSYVTNSNAYATDIDQVGVDLVALLRGFYAQTGMNDSPLYIFCESYGGKMASAFAREIVKAINDGTLQSNFKGVGLGDSWISPIDSVNTWGDYLYGTSLLDKHGLVRVNEGAAAVQNAINNNDWERATQLWSVTEVLISANTDNVDFYNILYPHHPESSSRMKNASFYGVPEYLGPLFNRHVAAFATDPLSELMNGEFKDYLQIIPNDVVWGSQSGDVFNYMRGDFMKPTVDIVDTNIQDGILVVVYNGMLDLIVDTPGQELWLEKLNWGKIQDFMNEKWSPRYTKQGADTGGYSKSLDNFSFWWVIDAGHMVPTDQGEFMLYLLHDTCTK